MNLFYLADARFGGWPTFTAHLFSGLGRANVYKVGKTTEKRTRDFGRGITYQNVSLATARSLAAQEPSLITAASPKRSEDVAELLSAGAGIVVHDPTELKHGMPEVLKGTRPFVIRRSMLAHLPDARLMPHPYFRLRPVRAPVVHAVAFSRIDFDKHTDIIVKANALLPPDRRVYIYGSVNRMYAHHKLEKECPGWESSYSAPLPIGLMHAGAMLAARARNVVDMSAIAGDGGGTQYTFLEAMDGGAHLILNAAWRTGPDDEMAQAWPDYVRDAEGLADLLSGDDWDSRSYDDILNAHDATHIARRLEASL